MPSKICMLAKVHVLVCHYVYIKLTCNSLNCSIIILNSHVHFRPVCAHTEMIDSLLLSKVLAIVMYTEII